MKLNLGCGAIRLDGYINVDLYRDCDMRLDITKPLPFLDGSIEEINASHVIEHFTRREWEDMRRDWLRVLEYGGKLFITCPDLEQVLPKYLETKKEEYLMMIYGGQEDYGNGELHKNGFTLQRLNGQLRATGFFINKAKRENLVLKVECTKL